MALYLAVDLGTTGCRSMIFDEGLEIRGSSYREYGLITPDENRVEQDAELWWELTLETAKEAIAHSGVDPKEIMGISVSSQGITVVPVDRNFTPLCNAISWLDKRAKEETAEIEADFGGREIFRHTGKMNTPGYTLPKLLWMRKNMPEIWERAYKLLMPLDFLTARLTGKCVTDYSMASGTLFYDIKNSRWSEKILNKYGIDREKLPEIMPSGSRVGRVRPEVAAELGLNDECIVAVGAQDQKCAARGVGLDGETVTISLGTAAAITRLWKEHAPDKCDNIGWCGYTCANLWVTEGVIGTAGTSLRWVRDLMFREEKYSTVDREAEEAIKRGSSVVFIPNLSGPDGPEYYKGACGVFYGMSLATDRGSIAAAVMEGIAFKIRTHLEAMDAYGSSKRIILFGGGAKGSLWPQIIADVTGLEILTTATAEAASAGAAILAAEGCGRDIGTVECTGSYKPSERAEAYLEKYKSFKKLEKALWQEKGI